MNFGEAINRMRGGSAMRREGWNGKRQFVVWSSFGSVLSPGLEGVYADFFLDGSVPMNSGIEPCLSMVVLDESFSKVVSLQPGWLASQPDMLEGDWVHFVENGSRG